ncbi:MAG: DUF5685 family protein [Clostridia bacterium]|nr:DUF5685 family protein [Clostridia bacterium]
MFGYITPCKETLSEEDKNLFGAYYCSLCREIGKRSQTARMFLSYDMAFLAILTASLDSAEPNPGKNKRCVIHPTRPTPILTSTHISYAADLSVILIKEKLKDDIKDEGSVKSRVANSAISDRVEENAEVRRIIITQLEKLSRIEKDNIKNPDMAADSFAVMMGKIFELAPIPDKSKKPMYWLGYNLGRWVYLLDAYCDIEKDLKSGAYNPFLRKISEDEAKEMLSFTLSEAFAAFDLLDIKRYRSILENVLLEGLPIRQNYCLFGNRKDLRE